MLKNYTLPTLLITSLVGPSLANAAFYDFQDWIGANGEQGFDNSSPFTMTDSGLTLTATATEEPGSVASHVYMDDSYNGIIGGMGVCSSLNTSSPPQCSNSGDDNVSIDGTNSEILSWQFTQNITEVTLELGNADHYDYILKDIFYKYDGGSWMQVASNTDAMVTLSLDGSSNQIHFKAVGADQGDHFYIRNANVAAVPIPAAAWLFGSALVGLAVIARKKR